MHRCPPFVTQKISEKWIRKQAGAITDAARAAGCIIGDREATIALHMNAMRPEPAPQLESLCATFRELAQEVWREQRQAVELQLPYHEETITQRLLVKLKAKHRNEVRINSFSKTREGKTGADWAWWFKGKQWFGAIVQAKRLNPSTATYDELGRFVGRSKKTRQVDVLMKHGRSSGMYPLYCLYNTWGPRLETHALALPGCPVPDDSFLGCTIATASRVRTLVRAGVNDLYSLLPATLPWCCLVCCGHDEMDPAERAYTAISDLHQLEYPHRIIGYEPGTGDPFADARGIRGVFPPDELLERFVYQERSTERARVRNPRSARLPAVPELTDHPPSWVLAIERRPDVVPDGVPENIAGVVIIRERQ